MKNHQFTPKELLVPAGQKVKITVRNQDATPAEFESSDLNREKVVSANSEISVFVGPLDPGRYVFFDDFHRETTSGVIIAK
jgi:plastocyanin